jgi:hypothetical protein
MDAGMDVDIDEDAPEPECWCCGKPFPESRLVRLGSHPEAAVCFQCAKFLRRRANEEDDQLHGNRSPAAVARAAIQQGRGIVVSHGWQRKPLVGPVLRGIGKLLP